MILASTLSTIGGLLLWPQRFAAEHLTSSRYPGSIKLRCSLGFLLHRSIYFLTFVWQPLNEQPQLDVCVLTGRAVETLYLKLT